MNTIVQTLRRSELTISMMILTLLLSFGVCLCCAEVSGAVYAADSAEPVIDGADSIDRGSDRGDFDLRSYGVKSKYPLKYESADESILTVSDEGFVQLRSAGETVIRVTADGQDEVKLINVTIRKEKRPSLKIRYCTDYEGDLSGSTVIDVQYNSRGNFMNSAYTKAYIALDDESIRAQIIPRDHNSQIDSNGVVTFDPSALKESSPSYALLTIVTEETDLYTETGFGILVRLLKHEREMYFRESSVSANMTDGGYQLDLVCRPYEEVSYWSSNPEIATVDQFGYVKFINSGEVRIEATVPETEKYETKAVTAAIKINENRKKQTIMGVPANGVYTFTFGEDVNLGLSAHTPLTYSFYDVKDPDLATLDSNGTIHFNKPGTVLLQVEAAASTEYFDAGRIIVVVAEDPAVVAAREEEERRKAEAAAEEARRKAEAEAAAAEEARRKAEAEEARKKAEAAAAEEARKKAEAAAAAAVIQSNQTHTAATANQASYSKVSVNELAKSLKRPKLKCKRKKKCNKLTWSKVTGATGYVLYVKYPGTKKYVKALTKNGNTKSVTHRGLTKGRTYRYKIRPYVKIGHIIAYGRFSKSVAAKVK